MFDSFILQSATKTSTMHEGMEADLKSLQQKIQDLESKLSFTHTELEENPLNIKIDKPNQNAKVTENRKQFNIKIDMFSGIKK